MNRPSHQCVKVHDAKRARRRLQGYGWELKGFGIHSTLFWAGYVKDFPEGRRHLKIYVN